MFQTLRVSLLTSMFVLMAACLDVADGGNAVDVNPPDWILGTWEDDRGEQWVFSNDDIETTMAGTGTLTSLGDSYDSVSDVESTDDRYVVEASLFGLPTEFAFEKTSDTTFVTSNVTYVLQ